MTFTHCDFINFKQHFRALIKLFISFFELTSFIIKSLRFHVLSFLLLTYTSTNAQEITQLRTDTGNYLVTSVGLGYTIYQKCSYYKLVKHFKPESFKPDYFFKKDSYGKDNWYYQLNEKEKQVDVYLTFGKNTRTWDRFPILHKDSINMCLFGLRDEKGTFIVPISYAAIDLMPTIDAAENPILSMNKDNDKWGLYFCKTNLIVPMEYEPFSFTPTGKMIILKKNNKYGLMDFSGKIRQPLKFDNIYALTDFTIFESNGFEGVIDATFEEVIPARYDKIIDYYQGVCVVRNNNWSQPKIPLIIRGDSMMEGYSEFERNNLFLVNRKGDTLNNEYYNRLYFSPSLIFTQKTTIRSRFFGVLNDRGQELQPTKYDAILYYDKVRHNYRSISEYHKIQDIDSSFTFIAIIHNEGFYCINASGNLLNKEPYNTTKKATDLFILEKKVTTNKSLYSLLNKRGYLLAPYMFVKIEKLKTGYVLVDTSGVYYTYDTAKDKLSKSIINQSDENTYDTRHFTTIDKKPVSPISTSERDVENYLKKQLIEKFPNESFSIILKVCIDKLGVVKTAEVVNFEKQDTIKRNEIKRVLLSIAMQLPRYSPAQKSDDGRHVNACIYYTIRHNQSEQSTNLSDTGVVSFCEVMPAFPGENDGLQSYIKNNLRYPQTALTNKIERVIWVDFIIEKDGHTSNISIIKPEGWGFDEEAIRLVTEMPNWRCGKNNGKPVRAKYRIPIKFSIK